MVRMIDFSHPGSFFLPSMFAYFALNYDVCVRWDALQRKRSLTREKGARQQKKGQTNKSEGENSATNRNANDFILSHPLVEGCAG